MSERYPGTEYTSADGGHLCGQESLSRQIIFCSLFFDGIEKNAIVSTVQRTRLMLRVHDHANYFVYISATVLLREICACIKLLFTLRLHGEAKATKSTERNTCEHQTGARISLHFFFCFVFHFFPLPIICDSSVCVQTLLHIRFHGILIAFFSIGRYCNVRLI